MLIVFVLFIERSQYIHPESWITVYIRVASAVSGAKPNLPSNEEQLGLKLLFREFEFVVPL